MYHIISHSHVCVCVTRVCTCIHMFVHTCVCMIYCTYMCMYMHTYAHTCVHTHACAYIHAMYINVYIHTTSCNCLYDQLSHVLPLPSSSSTHLATLMSSSDIAPDTFVSVEKFALNTRWKALPDVGGTRTTCFLHFPSSPSPSAIRCNKLL